MVSNDGLVDVYLQDGPEVYILQSILIHHGGAYGGHYYAYILVDGQWVEFNDNRVGKVQDIQGMIQDATCNGYMFNYVRVGALQRENGEGQKQQNGEEQIQP